MVLSRQSRQEALMAWQLQEAKQKLSEVVDRALDDGPQTITRRGVEVVVVLAVDEYRRLTANKRDLRDFLLDPNGPDFSDLDLERDKSLFRDVEL
jgi:prevent-host-death family protein